MYDVRIVPSRLDVGMKASRLISPLVQSRPVSNSRATLSELGVLAIPRMVILYTLIIHNTDAEAGRSVRRWLQQPVLLAN